MRRLKYGNTSTYLVEGSQGFLLVDTDYAGTLQAFYKALKQNEIRVRDIAYVMATHYHPDHMGLIGALMQQGVQLLLLDVQQASVHFSDPIFAKDQIAVVPVDESQAVTISCAESRAFLKSIGIDGQIIHTPSHSVDSVSLVLDEGTCFVGDLESFEYIEVYGENTSLQKDWEKLLSFKPKMICYAHRPDGQVKAEEGENQNVKK